MPKTNRILSEADFPVLGACKLRLPVLISWLGYLQLCDFPSVMTPLISVSVPLENAVNDTAVLEKFSLIILLLLKPFDPFL